MNILGQLGYCDSTTMSAMYDDNDAGRDAFLTDCNTVNLAVDVVSCDYVVAKDEKGLTTGEWQRGEGGMLAWGV
jgi:hypothetical protein